MIYTEPEGLQFRKFDFHQSNDALVGKLVLIEMEGDQVIPDKLGEKFQGSISERVRS